VDAALDPWTWAPLAGAAVLQIDDWDEEIAEYATDHHPLFGSEKEATDARGWTGNLGDYVYLASALATPSGPEPADWAWSKLKGIAVGGGARGLTLLTVDVLKDSFPRDRPNDSGDRSFPSQHAARMSVNATLTARNLRSMPIDPWLRTALNGGVLSLAAAGSWSRVEAGDHFPSDILVGAALGHFLGAFFYDAFLGLPLEEGALSIEPARDGVAVGLSLRF